MGMDDQVVSRGQRQGLVLATSGGENLSGRLGLQLCFGVNLGEKTVDTYLSIAFVIGRPQVAVLMVSVVSFGKSQTSLRGGWKNGMIRPLIGDNPQFVTLGDCKSK